MRTLTKTEKNLRAINDALKLLGRIKENIISNAADNEVVAWWERVKRGGYFVRGSNISQEDADRINDKGPGVPLQAYVQGSNRGFKIGGVWWAFCSTKQGENIRQPHRGGEMPVGEKTGVTVWYLGMFGPFRTDVNYGVATAFHWPHHQHPTDVMDYLIHPKENKS